MTTTKNLLKCRYCAYTVLRFRGKQRGERHLRVHVLECHEEAYTQTMGFHVLDDDTPWTMDYDTRGEQAL